MLNSHVCSGSTPVIATPNASASLYSIYLSRPGYSIFNIFSTLPFIHSEFSNPSCPVYSNPPFIRHSRVPYCYMTMCKYLYVGNNTREYINLCRYFYYSCSHDWQSMPWKYYNDKLFFVYLVWIFSAKQCKWSEIFIKIPVKFRQCRTFSMIFWVWQHEKVHEKFRKNTG